MSNFKRLCLAIVFFICSPPAIAANSLNDDLIYRINFGKADDVKILLDQGADANAISNIGEHAISIATGRDDSEAVSIVKTLLDKGANPNVADKSGTYPIVNAVTNNKAEIVALLIAKNADVHVKSPTGKTLIEIAKSNYNNTIENMIQNELNKEAAYAASMRSPERFKEIIRHYAMDGCLYQYWNFVLGSRQSPDKDAETQKHIDDTKTDIAATVAQIQKYYPATPAANLKSVAGDASQKIYDILEAMVSNNNRIKQGVGREEDANGRCQKISESVQINFPPSVLK